MVVEHLCGPFILERTFILINRFAPFSGGHMRKYVFDSILDTVAVAFALTGLWAVWHGQGLTSAGCAFSALSVVWAGVERRQ